MSIEKFRAKFGRDHVVLPVIHVTSQSQTFKNIELVMECGADGAWLISHGQVLDVNMCDFQRLAINKYKWNHIGVNLLCSPTVQAFRLSDPRGIGVWTDNAYTEYERLVYRRDHVEEYRDLLGDALYFGGVAFKYQEQPDDVRRSTEIAKVYVDVITTSGAGTGIAADVSKIELMREGAGDHPLAIASGITPTNVVNYLPYTNAFLVATGINIDGDEFNIDKDKLKSLVETVHGYGT